MAHEKNPNPLNDLRKAQEEEYFRKQSLELAGKMKARLALSEAGISDEKLVDELSKAGFSGDACRALLLVPLIQVAWADGRIQDEEKEQILKFARQRGIEEGSEADKLISTWIEKEPTDDKFAQAKVLVEPIVEEMKRHGRDTADWIIASATKVAEATGGIFGIGNKVSREEEDFLRQIASNLKK